MAEQNSIKVTLLRSRHGRKPGHAETLAGLGLRRRHQSVVVANTPENRGMIDKIAYLCRVEEV